LAVLPFALWSVIRIGGLEDGRWSVQLMAFTPYAACCSVVPLVIALALRRWWTAGVAAATCLALVACVAPRAIPNLGHGTGPELRVLSVNLYRGRANIPAVMQLIRQHDVDVLAIQEYTPAAHRQFVAAGLLDVLPHAEAHPIPGVDGSAIFTRHTIRDAGVKINPGAGFRQAFATIELPDAGTVRVESVHPVSPSNQEMVKHWADGLRGQMPATAGGHVVLAGDFNATLDHVEMRRLMATGYRDAAAEVGKGLVATWPYAGREYRLIPRIAIDHVLVSPGIGVVSFAAFGIDGTDHRAILAELIVSD